MPTPPPLITQTEQNLELLNEQAVQQVQKVSVKLGQTPGLGPWLNWVVLGNPLKQWLLFAVLLLGVGGLLQWVLGLVKQQCYNWSLQKQGWLGLGLRCLASIKPWLLWAFLLEAFSLLCLKLPAPLTTFIGHLPMLAVLAQLALWARPFTQHAVHLFLENRSRPEQENEVRMLRTPLTIMGMGLLWILLGLLALDTVGINITALVTGLGIGGVAVALAVQNILGDLIASLSIVLDKPFIIGDLLVVGEFTGHVEHIGLKSTRLRSVNGEQIIIANSDLLASRLRNFKRMEERRVLLVLGVEYGTPVEKLEALPQQLKMLVEAVEGVRFERAHFKGFGVSALELELVYFMLSPEYDTFMETQQHVNVSILKHLQAEGVALAFPTQTLHVRQVG